MISYTKIVFCFGIIVFLLSTSCQSDRQKADINIDTIFDYSNYLIQYSLEANEIEQLKDKFYNDLGYKSRIRGKLKLLLLNDSLVTIDKNDIVIKLDSHRFSINTDYADIFKGPGSIDLKKDINYSIECFWYFDDTLLLNDIKKIRLGDVKYGESHIRIKEKLTK